MHVGGGAEPLLQIKMAKRPVQEVKIVLLDGSTICYDAKGVKRGAIMARDVIEEAHRKSGMEGEYESKFFSLYSYENCKTDIGAELNQKVFLDTRKSSRKLIEHFYTKEDRKSSTWTFLYGVKFYIPSPKVQQELRTEQARWLYYLQLCDDIRKKKIIITDTSETMDNCVKLMSLMQRARQFNPSPALESPALELVPKENQPSDYVKRIENAEIENTRVSDMEPARAVTEFIRFLSAWKPKYYGRHLFLARDLELEQQKHQATPSSLVTIANGRDGITIWDHDENGQIRETIPWENIVKLLYRRNKFCIKCSVEESEGGHDRKKRRKKIFFGGVEGKPQQAKWIWKNAVEQHAFPRVEHLGFRDVILARRTSFRYSGPNTDKYVIEKKENDTWKITESPPDNLSLKKVETVRVDIIRPIAAAPTLHFEIKQDKSGIYQLVKLSNDETTSQDMERTEGVLQEAATVTEPTM